MKLDGKSVLLTGATGGLGRAIAKALADRGAAVILSSRKHAELDELAASLPGRPAFRADSGLFQCPKPHSTGSWSTGSHQPV